MECRSQSRRSTFRPGISLTKTARRTAPCNGVTRKCCGKNTRDARKRKQTTKSKTGAGKTGGKKSKGAEAPQKKARTDKFVPEAVQESSESSTEQSEEETEVDSSSDDVAIDDSQPGTSKPIKFRSTKNC